MIPYSCQSIDKSDIQSLINALNSPNLTQGEETLAFENELAEFLGVKYVVSFNSATSALYCAYKALNLQDSQVITSPLSFVATSNMLLECKAIPVFCDIKSDGNIDENKIIPLITPKTKAIVSIDYAGKSVEADIIAQIAKEHNLYFISDSSHSFGGSYKGKKIGTLADITIFSFHALKPITTAEGGAIATNHESLATQAKLIRSHGIIKKHLWNSEVEQSGFNFRLTDLASALGRSQLKRIDSFLQRRQEIVDFYNQTFCNQPYFDTLQIPSYIKSTHHLYPIFLKQKFWCVKEEIFQALQNQGLGVQVHYKPITNFALYQRLFPNLPPLYNANAFYKSELSIPCHQKMTLQDARFCAEVLLDTLSSF